MNSIKAVLWHDVYCLNQPLKTHIFKPLLVSCFRYIMCSCFIWVWKEMSFRICSVLLFQIDLLCQILSTSHPAVIFCVSHVNWTLQVAFPSPQNCHCGSCVSSEVSPRLLRYWSVKGFLVVCLIVRGFSWSTWMAAIKYYLLYLLAA